MNTNTSHKLQRMSLSLVIAAGLIVLTATDATAHEVEYRPYYATVHYGYARTKFYPGWLYRNRDFRRWYFHNQYRFDRRISWRRIYDVYRFERRHRWYGRRIYGKTHHSQGYRKHYRQPKNHRH